VFVKEEGNGSVRVKVNTIYRQTRASNLTMPTTIDCVSTGSLESKIHIAVKEKL
jgi:hypothetical protein